MTTIKGNLPKPPAESSVATYTTKDFWEDVTKFQKRLSETLSWNSINRSLGTYSFMTTEALTEIATAKKFIETAYECGTDYCWEADYYDYHESYGAIDALSRRGEAGKAVIIDLARTCEDHSVNIRAIKALGDMPGDDVADVMVGLTRNYAVVLKALANRPGTKATDAIIGMAMHYPEAIDALGKRQGDKEKIVGALIDIARNGKNRDIRETAIWTLADQPGVYAGYAILEMVNDLEDEFVRAVAARALATRPEYGIFSPFIKELPFSRLTTAGLFDLAINKEEKTDVRCDAIRALAMRSEPDASGTLWKLAEFSKKNPSELYETVIDAIADRPGAEFTLALERLAHNGVSEINEYRSGTDYSWYELVDYDCHVSDLAIAALSRRGEAGKAAIKDLAKNADIVDVRAEAILTLAYLYTIGWLQKTLTNR